MREPIQGQPLAPLTTIRTGGSAEFFARAGSRAELDELILWAVSRDLPIAVIGLGSNLLVADEGVPGLVLRLDRELARVEPVGERLRCGGGARLALIAARAGQLGLRGIEFGATIPGTIGGALRMNATAYKGKLGEVVDWVDVHSPAGREQRPVGQLELGYRCSNLRSDEVVARVELVLKPALVEEITARAADLREHRRLSQPSARVRSFGSTFKNLPSGQAAWEVLAEAGARDLRVGGARFSEKHANFIQNTGAATTSEIVELMGKAHRLVVERLGIELEAEVQRLGPIRFPWLE